MGGAAAAIIAMKQKQIVEAFRNARATSVNSVRRLADLGIDDTRLFRGLMRQGIILEASPGTFYLDEAAYQRFRETRIKIVLALLVIVALAAAWAFWRTAQVVTH